MADERASRDLVVAQGSYAYIQNKNTGTISTVVGPKKITLDVNDQPVVYVGRSQFKAVADPNQAVKFSLVIPEGFYCVLVNPSADGTVAHPREASNAEPPALQIGNKIVIEGPAMFALWPGQEAEPIRGHQLRSNEYLIGRVYNEEEARENAGKARIVRANTEGEEQTVEVPALFDAKNLTVGQLIIIPGTQVSFYIPPTGISVLRDENTGQYVREAITLEQLEYCVLLDENGKKRFERGPKVVFPTATEKFMTKEGKNKFRAIELNPIQGLHIKATAAYEDSVLGRMIKEGEEFFITGKDFPIYFPREEHSIVKYDGKDKQFAISIPKGEGRYVLERHTGNVRMVTGPNMLLPNPVIEVPVRRVLSDQECVLWYPGNAEVIQFNRELRELSASSPTTRGGAVSEGEINRAARKASRGTVMASASLGNSLEMAANSSQVSSAYGAGLSDEIERSSTYTTPRSLTLNTKLQGVPRIAIWPGYAIRVEDSSGQTRVEIGPKVVLLEYDEVLSVLSFSQGTPKTSDNPMRTPYLRIMNNKVTDQLTVETRDHAFIQLTLSYLVSFDPAMKDRWFNIDNYIKLMCDRTRAEITSAVRGIDVAKFHEDPMSILSRVVMNEEESRTFEENGMMITSFELRDFRFGDKTVAELLIGAQSKKLISNVAIINATTEKDRIVSLENIKTEQANAQAEARIAQAAEEKRVIETEERLANERHKVEMNRLDNEKLQTVAQEAIDQITVTSEVSRMEAKWRAEEQHTINMATIARENLSAEAEAIVKRVEALQPGFIEAMVYLGQSDVAARIAEAGSIQRAIGADSFADLFQKVAKPFTNGEAGEVLASVAKKVLPNGGDSRVDRR